MGYALVSAGATATTLSPAFGASTGSGNLLVAWMFSNANSASAPYSTAATGWTSVVQFGAAFAWGGIFYKANSSAGETAPVFTAAGGPSAIFCKLAEFSGGATASPADQSGSNGAGSFAGAQTATAAAHDTQAGDLIVFCAGWNGSTSSLTITSTMADGAGNSITPTAYNNSGTGTGFNYDFCWGIQVAAGASGDTATGTLSGAENGVAGIASFLAAATGVAGQVQPRATVPVPRRRPARAGAWDVVTGPANAAPVPPAPPAVIMAGRASRQVETYRLVSG